MCFQYLLADYNQNIHTMHYEINEMHELDDRLLSESKRFLASGASANKT